MTNINLTELAKEIYSVNLEKGFHNSPRSTSQISLLFIEEIMEAFSVIRTDINKKSDKIPESLHFHEEICDLIIRVLDIMYSKIHEIENRQIIVKPHLSFLNMNNFDLENPNYNYLLSLVDVCTLYGLENDIKYLSIILDGVFSMFDHDLLMTTMRSKIDYNKSRPYLHGRKF